LISISKICYLLLYCPWLTAEEGMRRIKVAAKGCCPCWLGLGLGHR
jgi:hypothetical protein